MRILSHNTMLHRQGSPVTTLWPLIFFLILLPALLISGCARKSTPTYRIGVSQCSNDKWRDKVNQEILRESMAHDNIQVEIRSASDNTKTQIEDIRYFADNDFDLLIVAPNEVAPLTPVIEELYDKGLPVIIFDREISSGKYTARIEGDNSGLGAAAARYAKARSKSHHLNFLELTGLSESSPAVKRHQGFISEIEKMPDAEVVVSVDGKWNQQRAREVTDSILRLYPQINVVFAHNDFMAIGASEAIRSRGRDDVMIIGIDATPEVGIKAVADSLITATFIYPTDGYRLIRKAKDILEGTPFSKEEIIPATSAVDLTNADILLQQNEQFNQENNSIPLLSRRLKDIRSRHSYQTTYLYLTIAAIVILILMLYIIARMLIRTRHLHTMLASQNARLAEEGLKQQELYRKLEEATQSKLNFFTSISHDLRTPLTLISDPVERMTKADYLSPADHQLMKIANKNVKVLHRLINQILDFRKHETGHLTLRLSEINAGATIREWSQAFMDLSLQRGIQLNIDTSGAEGTIVAVDTEKLERILFNLMSNAFRHTPSGKSITLSTTVENNNLILKVADTGSGIPDCDLKYIFDRFYRVPEDEASPTARTGSGIGLAVTKAFVELHGGSISVESTLGEGSCFTVTIPVKPLPAKLNDDAETVPGNAMTSTVTELETLDPKPLSQRAPLSPMMEDNDRPILLIVEDNKDMLLLIGTALNDEYSILTASNGAEGLRIAKKYIPDLIISDVMMPVMDGFEFCSKIKSEVATSHIPVLLLTACALDEQRIMGYSEGADSYLSKPFNAELIRTRCQNLLDNRRRVKDTFGLTSLNITPRRPLSDVSSSEAELPTFASGEQLDSEFYRKFLETVMKNLGNSELTVIDIASELGLGQSQFGRKIKSITGYPPVTLIRIIRLYRARTLLLTTEKNVSEICYEVGFTSPAYFSKSYFELFGQTPSATRSTEENGK